MAIFQSCKRANFFLWYTVSSDKLACFINILKCCVNWTVFIYSNIQQWHYVWWNTHSDKKNTWSSWSADISSTCLSFSISCWRSCTKSRNSTSSLSSPWIWFSASHTNIASQTLQYTSRHQSQFDGGTALPVCSRLWFKVLPVDPLLWPCTFSSNSTNFSHSDT